MPSSIGPRPPSEKAKIIGEYKVLSKIGSGSFATVWKAVHVRTGIFVAIKAINREKIRCLANGLERFDSEINVMMSMCHDNIVKLLGIHRSHRHVYLIIEYCDHDLSAYIRSLGRPLTESEAAKLLADLVAGLQFLHNNNLAHRDLKPQNLLLTNNDSTLKIADFGFARDTGSESMAETICGSPLYMAPEILRNDSYDAKVADIWSVGAILFEMLTCKPPYSARNTIELLRKIDSLPLQVPSCLSTSCRSIINGLLNRDAKSRLSLSQIQCHTFLNINQIPKNLLTIEQEQERVDLDDIGFFSYNVEDNISESDMQKLISLVSELGDNARDQPEIALALYTRCIQIMVHMRLNVRKAASSIDFRFDDWMGRRIDQISVQCRRLVFGHRNLTSSEDIEVNLEQYMYEKSLEIAREAAVGELVGETADRTLTQLRKATLLLQETLKHVQDVTDARAVQVLLHAIKIRIMNLISKSCIDGSIGDR